MDFSGRLKELRTNRMLSITKLAKRSNLSQSFICRIESGEKQPTLETLIKLSHGLGVSIGELLGEELMHEPESPAIAQIVANLRKLSAEQLQAFNQFLSSVTKQNASGDAPLTLQAIRLNPYELEELELELVFSANVSAVMEHRIPGGTERNMACFQLLDEENRKVPMELTPGNQKIFGREAEKTFLVRPAAPPAEGTVYSLYISRLLQANNFKYLLEDHVITFSADEILDLKPDHHKLRSAYLSLSLERCSLASGDEHVPLDTEIKLTFSNDVISKPVREHNLRCFSLQTSKNRPVELDVIMAEPNHLGKKTELIVRPRSPLAGNTVYLLTISENLMGINRKRLGSDKVITFTTGSALSSARGGQKIETTA